VRPDPELGLSLPDFKDNLIAPPSWDNINKQALNKTGRILFVPAIDQKTAKTNVKKHNREMLLFW
jgi:hypothetical protein